MDPAGTAASVDAWQRMRPLSWRGTPCQQFPSDMLRYAEVLHELRPPFVVECGTGGGGAALFLACMLEGAIRGRVISIDNDPRPVGLTHPRLMLLKGDAADPAMVSRVAGFPDVRGRRGVVILDDDHSCGHVLGENLMIGLPSAPTVSVPHPTDNSHRFRSRARAPGWTTARSIPHPIAGPPRHRHRRQ